MDDIDKEIDFLSRVLSQTPDDDPNMLRLLSSLGSAHDKRFKLREEPEDIHKVIEYASIVLALTADDSPTLPALLSLIGTAHGQRFLRLGDMSDVDQGIEFMSRALSITPDGHPHLHYYLSNLGTFYKERSEHLGEPGDIDKAIEYHSQAVAATPTDDPSLANRLEQLGSSYCHRFQRLGELSDIEKAIEYQSTGLALIPDNHPRLPLVLANLTVSHNERFQRLGELSDNEKAIEYETRALPLIHDGHPHLALHLGNLGTSHRNRFDRLGELDDLEKAINYKSRALDVTPDNHPNRPIRLLNLGVSHADRFKRLGELDDIEKAINYGSRALALTPDGHPELSRRLTYLGVSHMTRYERLSELDDLQKSIEYGGLALDSTPDTHPDFPGRLANLATCHSYRFRRLGEIDDLEKSIEYSFHALALVPDDHPDLPGHLSNLGDSHIRRFRCLSESDDLDKAIEYRSRALEKVPDDHPNFPAHLINLAECHRDRFRLLSELDDLEKAIKYQSRALAVTSTDHPLSCLIHYNHAITHVEYYEHSNDTSHLQVALSSFRIASTSVVGVPRDRFRYAEQWAVRASRNSALSCIEAYQTMIDLLPQFIWLGATASQRYEDLKMGESLAMDAAYAATLYSDNSLALEWLEHARCIVWNQLLMLRSPLDELQAAHPSLGARVQKVATELHSATFESRDLSALSSSSMTPEDIGQRLRRLAKEYEELLTQARTLPNFEDFLRPMKSNRLVGAAKNGPVVVISCHNDRSIALLILPNQNDVAHLFLPNFTRKKARTARSSIESSLRRRGLRERGVRIWREAEDNDEFGKALACLWNDVVKPVLDFLGYTNNVSTENLPHITWCPTGAASFLPLHAAGDYDSKGSRIFDYAISSYTPTLTALLLCTPSTLSRNSRVLGVGQAATPGHQPLPGTTTELGYVKSQVENKIGYSQLMGDQAIPSTVLNAMEEHDWVHLACHAHQNVNDPTQSGFFLYEGTLDLAAINQRSFKKKGLAFLSACQTATGDEERADEAMHIASGMLMAGYSSVIATMWSIVDEDAPFVTDKVYSQLMEGGSLGNGEAGKALHNAISGLREQVGETEFGRWVPYIHIGS
ncbi:unnamed protein product [Rhizoctonia solani]|uniref:CHAT domain-containing protein n=1 Tax=Rhizoctonia solani TaxID=456999 RepID=A0A8H3C7G9_9AGAM|nr:unnamed protein product [Rhizoctonia solani]